MPKLGVVGVEERPRLSGMCAGCKRADWVNNECYAVVDPCSAWADGKCKKRLMPSRAEITAEVEAYHAQYGRPDPWEDPLGWLAATHSPSRKEKPIHCPLPAPPRGGGESKSGRKRKKKPPKMWVNPWV